MQTNSNNTFGEKIIDNADTQRVSRRALARIPSQLWGEKSLCLQCDTGDSQLSSLRAESKVSRVTAGGCDTEHKLASIPQNTECVDISMTWHL